MSLGTPSRLIIGTQIGRGDMMSESQEHSLQGLHVLIGEWDTEATHPRLPGTVVPGRCVFEWLEGEKFLILRSHSDHPDFPDGISILGDTGGLRMHYFDSRGVARIYQMKLIDGVWALWRDRADLSPLDFAQRFVGTFSVDGQSIHGRWEACHDGTTWEDDLKITYQRTTGASRG